MMSNNHKQAVSIFEKVESTLIRNRVSGFNRQSRKRAIRDLKERLQYFRTASDDEFFFRMTMVVFYSGFQATIVTKRESVIKRYFKSYKKSAAYRRKDICRILNDPKMIAHRNKIESIIYNATQFIKLIEQFGSFRDHLFSFCAGFPLAEDGLDDLREDLRTRFKYLGPATVNHFLMDYGFLVVKPDRMLMRVLHRSHLVGSESERHYGKAIEVCKDISEQLHIPIQYVDSVFVCLGQVGEANICSKKKPQCERCDLERICKFYVA